MGMNQVSDFSGLATATIYEANEKLGDMAPDIRPVVAGMRLLGPAFTIKCLPGETLAVLQAVDLAQPGDVLVIDAGATDRATVWGGSSTLAAQERGLVGCVTNGCVRDLDELRDLGFAVFAAGVSVRGTLKNHPGWHGVPVSVGGVSVNPGDIVIGDADGVVVVAAERAAETAARAIQQKQTEQERDRRLRAGEPLTAVLGLPARER